MSLVINTPESIIKVRFTNEKGEIDFAWYMQIGGTLIYIDSFSAHCFLKTFGHIVVYDNGHAGDAKFEFVKS